MGVTQKTTGPVTRRVKGPTVIRYHDLLRRKMSETKSDEQTFFRMAHIFLFGTDPDLSNDVAQYKLHAIIPVYVIRYLEQL